MDNHEHERRLVAAEEAVSNSRFNGCTSRDTAISAITAYNSPLPPEMQLVTGEMVKAYCRSLHISYKPNNHKLREAAIGAAMLESPVIKAAQVWAAPITDEWIVRDGARDLHSAMKEAGLT
jgi:hypothetical protein